MEKTIIFGGGCFWCLEAIFQRVNGVKSIVSGYSGGNITTPTYREVCSGSTGHAEVVQITYNPEVITLKELCNIFFTIHNPTTKNEQGADKGSQYRSIILYVDDVEKEIINISIKEAQTKYKNPIVTEVVKLAAFYPAEEYHQNYYNKNPDQPYCAAVIEPKLQKFFKKSI